MPERTLLRIGSVSAIVGAVLGVIVNVLHPRIPDYTDMEAFLQEVVDSTIWVGDHVGILVAVLLVVGGLVALYRSITDEPGAAWARLGFTTALVSAGIISVGVGTDGYAMKRIAETWMGASGSEKATVFSVAQALGHINFGIFSVWVIVFWGATIILYGMAVALSNVYPKWLGWAAGVLGTGATLVGLVQMYQGPSFLITNVLFPIFSILITLWILVIGVLMWRKAAAVS